MDVTELRNPYDFKDPVGRELFAGRSEELEILRRELEEVAEDRPARFAAVSGKRFAGKTSLLNRVACMAEEKGMLPVRVDLVAGDAAGPVEFFAKLYEELVSAVAGTVETIDPAAVRRVFAGQAPEAGFALEFPESHALMAPRGKVSEAALRADFQYLVKAVGKPIVLLVDEAQLLSGAGDVLAMLRSLGPRTTGMAFVLAGTPELVTAIDEVFGRPPRQVTQIRIGRFIECSDVENCMRFPLESIGLSEATFEDFHHTAHELHKLTDGNPYEIQLYCSEMFDRWQSGVVPKMGLSAEMLEAVRSRLESGHEFLDNILLQSVRAMTPDELIAFNILCSSLDHASPDELWFAYCLVEQPAITREFFDRCHARFTGSGLLCDSAPVRMRLETELFDEIYIRLWTLKQLGRQGHPQFFGRGDFKDLLVRRVSCMLSEVVTPPGRRLRTCCTRMDQGHVDDVLVALETLPDGEIPATVEFVHEAIVDSDALDALDVISVHCSYGEYYATRWVYAAAGENYLPEEGDAFRAAERRIADLGGRLDVERVRLPVRPEAEITAWLQRDSGRRLNGVIRNHLNAGYHAYARGDAERAFRLISAANTLRPTWESSNNLGYLALEAGRPGEALRLTALALELTDDAENRALSHYNAAMAHFLLGDLAASDTALRAAADELARREQGPYSPGFLHVPERAEDGTSRLRVEKDKPLSAGIEYARTFTAEPALASAQPEPAEPAAPLRVKSGPSVVLSVATEWWSVHGGLSTFNRDLCCALAEAGAKVFCVVLTATEAEKAAAAERKVTLLTAPETPGVPESVRLTLRPDLPGGTEPDLVIGHGRITGPAALILVAQHYRNARRLHFVHMVPDEIEWYKLDRTDDAGPRAEERTDLERRLGMSAHRVVAVGPHLHTTFLNEMEGTDLPPLRLDPGFDLISDPRTGPPGGTVKVLLFGRTEDHRLKGLDLAAEACGLVEEWRRDRGLPGMNLVVRGAPEGSAAEQQQRLRAWAKNPRLTIVVREYSADTEKLTGDLMRSSLVLMPSRKEGFGLVGVEAVRMGVPLLVSDASGLARLLREHLTPEEAARMIVPVTDDEEKDAQLWARAIDRTLDDPKAAFDRAAVLRRRLAEKITWAAAAELLLAEAPQAGGSERVRGTPPPGA
ncbi:glycosyltransferase [Actinocorallia sp. B10E7]|uniref:glycosyltransferase n=1 Tax=Actinocorallia sp. B10E7 TaxID=3153558 RepID=UPI00325EF599